MLGASVRLIDLATASIAETASDASPLRPPRTSDVFGGLPPARAAWPGVDRCCSAPRRSHGAFDRPPSRYARSLPAPGGVLVARRDPLLLQLPRQRAGDNRPRKV